MSLKIKRTCVRAKNDMPGLKLVFPLSSSRESPGFDGWIGLAPEVQSSVGILAPSDEKGGPWGVCRFSVPNCGFLPALPAKCLEKCQELCKRNVRLLRDEPAISGLEGDTNFVKEKAEQLKTLAGGTPEP